MSELSAKEMDLLERVKTNQDLKPLFFRRVKGLRWFDAIADAGYFEPSQMPKPIPAKQEGYVTIPRWEIAEYLTKTAPEVAGSAGERYSERFIAVMAQATSFAKANDFSNYQTWWQFAVAISKLPSRFVSIQFLESVDYWLDDNIDRGLVATELGEQWLIGLLEEGTEHALSLAGRLLQLLFKVTTFDERSADMKKRKTMLRLDHYHASQIIEKAACVAGRRLGTLAFDVFYSGLQTALVAENNDKWSSIWQPAIEKHPQNEHHHDTENTLLSGLRDCLEGVLVAQPEKGCQIVGSMLDSELQTINRVAIYCMTKHYGLLAEYTERVLDERFLSSNFLHEMWHFLSGTYGQFNDKFKEKTLSLILTRRRLDENGVYLEAATAYQQAIWYSAIKDLGQRENALYRAAVSIAKSEPENPDFSSFLSTGWIGPRSPFSVDQLAGMTIAEIANALAGVTEGESWDEPGIEGLAKTFKELVKSDPLRFYSEFRFFESLNLEYVQAIIEAYAELWSDKTKLPWSDIWERILGL